MAVTETGPYHNGAPDDRSDPCDALVYDSSGVGRRPVKVSSGSSLFQGGSVKAVGAQEIVARPMSPGVSYSHFPSKKASVIAVKVDYRPTREGRFGPILL